MRDSDSATTMRIDIRPEFDSERSGRSCKKDADKLSGSSEMGFKRTREYTELLESVYDGVIITEDKGLIRDFNSRACDLLMCEGNALYGTSILDIISGADDKLLNSIWQNLMEHRYTLIEAQCLRKDTSFFPAEIAVNKVNLKEWGKLCFLIRDISVRKKAQEALEEAIEDLEAHDRDRSQFVSNISHELRTPLTSMTYAVKNMLKGVAGELSEPVRRYLEMLDGDTKRMLGTVNDILDLTRMDTGRFTMVTGRVPFARIVRNTVESLRVQAEQKGVKLEGTENQTGLFVDCDSQKMERVILNIVGNAIKFTSQGGLVKIDLKADPDRRGYVRLSVTDSGLGIPADAIARVTDRYFTVGSQPSGSGLGLAITREIIERHKGFLDIESPPAGHEKGTAVTVSLPGAEPPSVLVVDDEDQVRDLLALQVRQEGYHVEAVSDGTEALDQVKTGSFDIVILDIILPGMEGTEVLLRMKADKNTARTPVVVVTGAGLSAGAAEILRSFGVPAISKPWRKEDLLDKVEGAFFGAAVLGQ